MGTPPEATMTKLKTAAVSTILLLLCGGGALAEELPSAEEEMKAAHHVRFYHGANARTTATLTVESADGDSVESQFVMFRYDVDDEDDGDQKLLAYFTDGPAEGRSLLVYKHARAVDEGWVYEPELGSEQSVPADARTPFFGSHIYWEDLVGRPVDADEHVLENRALTYDTVRSTPRDPSRVEFDYYTTKIHRQRDAPMLVRYYKDDEVYREVETRTVHRIQGYNTLIWVEVRDLDSGGKTVLYLDGTQYDVDGVDETLFAREALRGAPSELMP